MRYFRRPVVVGCVAIAAAATLAGCTNASQTSGSTAAGSAPSNGATEQISAAPLNSKAAALLPPQIASKGILTVATDPTYAPFEFYGSDNKTVVGFDADMAAAIGQTLGIKIQMVPATFDTILPGIASGKYDIAMSSFSVTPERQKHADFVVYEATGSGLAVLPGNSKKLSLDDPLTMCGLKIAGEKGTTQAITFLPEFSKQCTDAGKPALDIQLFPSQDEANLALTSQRVDGVMSTSVSLAYQGKLANGRFELAAGKEFKAAPGGIALPKDSPLTPAIAAAVKALTTDPAYGKIFQKWEVPAGAEITAAQVG